MLFTYTILTSMISGSALSLASFSHLQPRSFHKRQEFNPNVNTCVPGNTCAESCGADYILCSKVSTTLLCYNPTAGESCCEGGSSSSWVCPADSFCLIDDFCCPDGEDPNSCAAANGISLPPTFVATTATPPAATSTDYVAISVTPTTTTPVQTPAVVYPASSSDVSSYTQPAASTTSPIVASFTGAADRKNVIGSTSLLYSILALIGQFL